MEESLGLSPVLSWCPAPLLVQAEGCSVSAFPLPSGSAQRFLFGTARGRLKHQNSGTRAMDVIYSASRLEASLPSVLGGVVESVYSFLMWFSAGFVSGHCRGTRYSSEQSRTLALNLQGKGGEGTRGQ